MKKLSDADPGNAALAMAVAQNQIFLKKHADAIETLRQSMWKANSSQYQMQMRQAIGDTFIAWLIHEKQTGVEDVDHKQKVWKLLLEAIRIAPNNPRVLGMLAAEVMKLSGNADDADLDKHTEALEDLPGGFAEFMKATIAVVAGKTQETDPLIDSAMENMPGSLNLMNNLAVAISARPTGEAAEDQNQELGLRLADAAIRKSPTPNAAFHETRGQILFGLKRYSDAIHDLEKAVAVPALEPAARKTLDECKRLLSE